MTPSVNCWLHDALGPKGGARRTDVPQYHGRPGNHSASAGRHGGRRQVQFVVGRLASGGQLVAASVAVRSASGRQLGYAPANLRDVPRVDATRAPWIHPSYPSLVAVRGWSLERRYFALYHDGLGRFGLVEKLAQVRRFDAATKDHVSRVTGKLDSQEVPRAK